MTEPTNNFIYESAHLVPLSANLCAFFVTHFHVFKMPVEYLEFSSHFYTVFNVDLTLLTLSGKRKEKKKERQLVYLLFSGTIVHVAKVPFGGRKEVLVSRCFFL